MTRAVAIGQVVQGDKEKPELTDMINTTCAVDLAELEGDEATRAPTFASWSTRWSRRSP